MIDLQRNTISIQGISSAYLDIGEGETIVALHGIPTSSLLFVPLMPYLKGYRLIAPDLLGQGLTHESPSGLLDYRAYREHLWGFMNHIPAERFYLLVHDLGGVLGLDWASEHVERLKGLVILSTTITGSWQVGKLLYAANLLLGRQLIRWGVGYTLKGNHALDDAWLEEWAKPWTRKRILRGMDHFAASHLRQLRSKLMRLRHVPTLLIWGEQDNIFPLGHAAAIREALPGAALKLIPHCGHWSTIDAPEAVSQHILEFWRTHG